MAYSNRLFGVALVGSLLAWGVTGCGSSSSKTDAGQDAQSDTSTTDTSTDMKADAGTDTTADTGGGTDALPDAGITPVKLVVSKTTVALTEGSSTAGMDTFTVKLDMPWSTPITVTLLSANTNVAVVVPETLEFAANDTGEQTVTVRAIEDDDIVDNSTTISISSVETGTATVKVDVKDSDVQALLATPTMVSINEAGATQAVSVRLAKKPASAVVVTAATSDAARLTAAPGTMTFTASNYSIPQQLTLTALADSDAVNDSVTLTLTPTGTIPALNIPVDIVDKDAVNLKVEPSSLMLVEKANMPKTVAVSLTLAPPSDVTVAVAVSNDKATVTPTMLTFTAANFATPQNITVDAASDDDSRDETATITLTASGITPVPAPRTVSVAIDDPDSQALQVTPTMLSMDEGGMGTFTVRLALNPGSASTVNVFSQNPGKVTVTPPVLSFNSTNFATPQTVTVTSLEDEDLVDDMVKITLAGSAAPSVDVPVTVKDNDKQSIQLIAASPGSPFVMQESMSGGPLSTSTLSVRLAYKPAAATTVLLTSSSPKIELSKSQLVFSPTDYNTAQQVTMTAPHDQDMIDDNVDITATATGVPLAALAVKVLDVDVQNFILSPLAPASPIAEGGSTAFTVRLTVIPATTVTASITSSNPKITVAPAMCTFTSANYNLGDCAITATAAEDNDARNETTTITIMDGASTIATRTISLNVNDNDTQALQVTAANPVIVSEAMGTAAFTVKLAADPIDPVTITLTPSLPGQIQLAPDGTTFSSTLSFQLTTANYGPGQQVTVQGLDDPDLLDQNLSIRVTATGLGVADQFVNVRKTDDDMQALVITNPPCGMPVSGGGLGPDPLAAAITEGAAPQTLCVNLRYQPEVTNSVTMNINQTPLPLGRTTPNFSVTPSTLMFNAMNYNVSQAVSINPIQDDNLDDETAVITASVTPFAPQRTINVSITDDDRPQAIMIGGMGSGAVNVALDEQSVAPVMNAGSTLQVNLKKMPLKAMMTDATSTEVLTITPTVTGMMVASDKVKLNSGACGAAVTLTFTNNDWDIQQGLTITPCTDANSTNEAVTLTITSSKKAVGTPDRTISVTIDDHDELLSVAVSGQGQIDSTPAGIGTCKAASGDCSELYARNAMITLSPTPSSVDWQLGAWGGTGCAGGAVTMASDRSCTARFDPKLSVTIAGTGSVTLPGGTVCSTGTCTEFVTLNTAAALTVSTTGTLVWSGDCTGTTDTMVTMSQPRTCTATFTP